MASGDKSSQAEAPGTSGMTGRGAAAVNRARKLLAQLVWLFCLVAALFLAVGVLLIALDANLDNQLVEFVLDGAELFDLGIFSVDNGIMKFEGENAETKNALFNWGLGAVVWLVVGRILDRVIRP